jgi:predicted dehydrogenase
MKTKNLSRRKFLATTGTALAGSLLARSSPAFYSAAGRQEKLRVALVGTGIRGTGMWGRDLVRGYSDVLEFVGLCDINPGRLQFGKGFIGADCPTYTDFEEMMKETGPDALIVTTVDATHHEFIIRGMELGADIITEKPLTTDEHKCQAILEAERKTGKKVRVTFNYRYSPHRLKLYQLLREGAIGRITSADFHWYLDTDHGASYFRRWHGLRAKSGTLLVHKASHHFDLLNWWLESDPEEVFALGQLEFYGRNHDFRGDKCRTCQHKSGCQFYFDITRDPLLMKLYVENEHHDGYIRDNCLWRNEIDIYDKMAATIRYANKVQVSYSLTTYSPYEGYRIAFNGTEGRLEAWIKERQPWVAEPYDELRLTGNFGETELIQVPHAGGGHGGGDTRLRDQIFRQNIEDTWRQSAGTRDGAMAILIGIAARNSIETGKPVRIGDLTELKPQAERA